MTARELRERFEEDLKTIQMNCKHEETERMEYHWAPGHSTGLVHVCKNCEKILD